MLSSDITPSLTSCTGMRASGRPRAAVRKILGRKRVGGREGGREGGRKGGRDGGRKGGREGGRKGGREGGRKGGRGGSERIV